MTIRTMEMTQIFVFSHPLIHMRRCDDAGGAGDWGGAIDDDHEDDINNDDFAACGYG